ncbi:MAG: hypothetical protein DMG06_08130 [Acidobacteria bacterium]|nr:MAG: hypothetical protein DMG06_08130 [Acidobacteriota bacterium]
MGNQLDVLPTRAEWLKRSGKVTPASAETIQEDLPKDLSMQKDTQAEADFQDKTADQWAK